MTFYFYDKLCKVNSNVRKLTEIDVKISLHNYSLFIVIKCWHFKKEVNCDGPFYLVLFLSFPYTCSHFSTSVFLLNCLALELSFETTNLFDHSIQKDTTAYTKRLTLAKIAIQMIFIFLSLSFSHYLSIFLSLPLTLSLSFTLYFSLAFPLSIFPPFSFFNLLYFSFFFLSTSFISLSLCPLSL